MIEKLTNIFSYHPYVDSDKLVVAVQSSLFFLIFILLFCYFYHKYFWKNEGARNLFWIFSAIFVPIVVGKFVMSAVYQSYIIDRLIFYAVPSPKIQNIVWLIVAVLAFVFFLLLRKKIEGLSTRKFLLSLLVFFFIFSVAVAGIREGWDSVIEPLTLTNREYNGNIPLISTTRDFLRDYTILQPELASHSTTHPPGYSLVVYALHKWFEAGLVGMSLWLVLFAGLALFPLYYFLRDFLSDIDTKRMLQLFIFIPSVVLLSATSFETIYLVVVWASIALCFLGWKKSTWFSILGGLAAGFALFSNFLFLLLAPFFAFLLWYSARDSSKLVRAKVLGRAFVSLASFFSFFVFFYLWADYSIIENFFVAQGAQGNAVGSNYESIGIYLTYFIMNIFAFGVALGVPHSYLLGKNIKSFFSKKHLMAMVGFFIVFLFAAIGVFQGEIARLWMSLVPFFLLPLSLIVRNYSSIKFNALLSLLFLQNMVLQILFYTYW